MNITGMMNDPPTFAAGEASLKRAGQEISALNQKIVNCTKKVAVFNNIYNVVTQVHCLEVDNPALIAYQEAVEEFEKFDNMTPRDMQQALEKIKTNLKICKSVLHQKLSALAMDEKHQINSEAYARQFALGYVGNEDDFAARKKYFAFITKALPQEGDVVREPKRPRLNPCVIKSAAGSITKLAAVDYFLCGLVNINRNKTVLNFWDLRTQKPISNLFINLEEVTDFAQNEKYLAVLNNNISITIYLKDIQGDLVNLTSVHCFEENLFLDNLNCLSFVKNTNVLLVGVSTGEIYELQIESPFKIIKHSAHKRGITAIDISEEHVATGSSDFNIQIRSVNDISKLVWFSIFSTSVRAISLCGQQVTGVSDNRGQPRAANGSRRAAKTTNNPIMSGVLVVNFEDTNKLYRTYEIDRIRSLILLEKELFTLSEESSEILCRDVSSDKVSAINPSANPTGKILSFTIVNRQVIAGTNAGEIVFF